MPQLDPTWFASQLFWLFITFGVLHFVLSRLVLPPLMGTIEKRQETLKSDVSLAQSLKTQAEDAKVVYERAMTDARSRSQQLINDAMLEHKAKVDDTAKRMDMEIAAKFSEAEKRIQAKKQELMQGLTPTSVELAGLIVEKLTRKQPDAATVQAAIGNLTKGER